MRSKLSLMTAAVLSVSAFATLAAYAGKNASDATISDQRAALAKSTDGAGLGPQSPRDIDTLGGENTRAFSEAPSYTQMNLCNIHFHEGAEHKGGEFNTYVGVRRQGIWNQDRRNLRECLAHLVDRIMRRVCGDASAAVRTSFA